MNFKIYIYIPVPVIISVGRVPKKISLFWTGFFIKLNLPMALCFLNFIKSFVEYTLNIEKIATSTLTRNGSARCFVFLYLY